MSILLSNGTFLIILLQLLDQDYFFFFTTAAIFSFINDPLRHLKYYKAKITEPNLNVFAFSLLGVQTIDKRLINDS